MMVLVFLEALHVCQIFCLLIRIQLKQIFGYRHSQSHSFILLPSVIIEHMPCLVCYATANIFIFEHMKQNHCIIPIPYFKYGLLNIAVDRCSFHFLILCKCILLSPIHYRLASYSVSFFIKLVFPIIIKGWNCIIIKIRCLASQHDP